MSDTLTFNAQIIEEFRANGGRVGGMFEGAPMVLLTTTGVKSGLPRTSPLVYLPDGDRYVLFASNGGSDANPSWYHNLVAEPAVTIEVGEEKFDATASVVDRPERDELYARQVEAIPSFGEYPKKTDRVIPVVVLERS